MTPSPSVTWPSPAMTTVPLRRTLRTVVERIRRFVGMSAILDYSSGHDVGASASLVLERQSQRPSTSHQETQRVQKTGTHERGRSHLYGTVYWSAIRGTASRAAKMPTVFQ